MTVRSRLVGLSGLAVAALVGVVASGAANAAVSENPVVTPVFNGPVYAVATAGNVVYVGGEFNSAVVRGKQAVRTRLAAFDATTGALLNWAPAADRTVRAVAVDPDGSVWAGGDFQTVDGQPRDSLARISAAGALDPVSFRVSGGSPRALAVGHGRLYVAGVFNAVNGVKRGNVAAIDLATRTLSGWSARTDDVVNALAVGGDRVYLGGAFHRVNDVGSTARLIAVKRDGGAVDMGFRPRPDSIVWGVTVSGDRVYAALGGRGGRAVSYTLNGVAKWAITTDGDAQAIAALGNTVYIGGHFDHVCRTARNGDHGVCLDGSVSRVKLAATDVDGKLLPWSPQGNGIRGVLALVANAQVGVVAAGEFTMLDGRSQKRIAVFR
ncbi:delta-60 repeat domain-containing protein [Virgisporangium ochraceum]|uniref:delta-60 repeat domain-containing protein n=1 Tax=Virgisporangium ochraceum TaxID=65505 RepID=UPI001944A936|nr:delta-60 repeat domain-containing protein [Virgisporangium ochraceum]